eukprot:3693769-Amphidinium_carterae.1
MTLQELLTRRMARNQVLVSASIIIARHSSSISTDNFGQKHGTGGCVDANNATAEGRMVSELSCVSRSEDKKKNADDQGLMWSHQTKLTKQENKMRGPALRVST